MNIHMERGPFVGRQINAEDVICACGHKFLEHDNPHQLESYLGVTFTDNCSKCGCESFHWRMRSA